MDRAVINFPTRWFGIVTQDWHIDTRGRSLGDGVTGAGQVVYGSMPRWTCTLSARRMLRREQNRAWRGLVARLRGRVNILRVQVNDPIRLWLAESGLSVAQARTLNRAGIPHEDGSYFDDGTGYTQSPSAPLLADAAAGATTLSIDGSYAGDGAEGGHMFTLGGWLYAVTTVDGTGTDTVLTIEPPLRAAAVAGDELDFDPWALMALADDMQGRLSLDAPWFGNASLSLVEWTGARA